jgi:DNA modification methylase
MLDVEQPTQTRITKIKVSDVRLVKELYPRLTEDNAAIERYRASIDSLPPIAIARDGILVDGYHRWQAHIRESLTEIEAENLGNLSDAEVVRESIIRNAKHGQQLSIADKKRLASILWRDFGMMKPGDRTTEIMTLLSVSERSVQAWTKDARTAEKNEQKAKAWDLWLNCYTEQNIANEMGIPQRTISDWLSEKRKDADFAKAPDSRQHFDVWNFAKANGDSTYFGQMPPQVVENLLWFYTEPDQIVFDPFAGGGTTIKVAKEMGRRIWSSDIAPSTPMLPIHEHNILEGWPADAPKQADFILLDPPYWKQAFERYGDNPQSLGNMSLDDFYAAWAEIIKTCAAHIAPHGRIAYIISPTQCEDGSVIDHTTDMLEACWKAKLKVERRIIVPYSTQQATGQQVTWARENRRLLKLYRDLVILVKK